MSIKYSVENLTADSAPLYCLFPGQISPQPAYVELSEAGTITAEYSGEVGNGVPATVWHRRALRWCVDPSADGRSLAVLLESADMLALFERVHGGHSVEWDGNNYVGRLTADAEAAREQIESLLEMQRPYDIVEIWSADDWIAGSFSLAELADAGSVVACAHAIEVNGCDSNQTITGDMARAVADRAAELVRRHINRSAVDDDNVRRSAALLCEYDSSEFAVLVAGYDDEFGHGDDA